ncbi:MAG: DUF5009 domain-containing protein [Kiritimatiellae bacterium]|nr:DUF5009 domain-containing protein [Kiritimatiellia bacterium]
MRLMSIDALRGFDMWFIIGSAGGAGLIALICSALGMPDCALALQMHHVAWEGFRHHDTIFPLFLFLAGVSWPFSLASQLEKGRTMKQIHLKIIMRGTILFAFGLAFGGIFKLIPTFRIPSVLGFIGISWAIAAIMFIHVKKISLRIGIIATLLFGYWAILSFIPAPGAPLNCDTYACEYNIVSYLDRTIMPNHIYKIGRYDPESLFGIIGGVATALLGMMAGSLLRSDFFSPTKKALALALGSLGLLLLDAIFIFALGDKIVKALWTPSFVLSAAAYSSFMLALFYYIIDVRAWRSWSFYFRVIGMNSITIYLAQRFVGVMHPTNYFFGGIKNAIGGPWGEVAFAAGSLVIVWAFLYFLYRNKIFLKV